MKRSYLDYAMSVIVSRALPDVRDGLKPVQRRILHAMREGGYDIGRPHRKSARIVGDVMGKYHPHGDSAIYDAMVRMAQDFSMRLPLVDGQGNFGSMDGDPAAAMRYTEARLAKPAGALLDDIDKDTVDFRPNYDESTDEPEVLPAQYPNILVNGAGGIAVGMATNVPPHNLGEVIDACLALIDDRDLELVDLAQIVQGPDFPTGGIVLGRGGFLQACATGRGSILMRGKAAVEEVRPGRSAIVVTEVPYQVNKARMIERIAEVVREKRVEGVSDLRDESDRHGVRVVIEIRREADPDVVLNQLYRYTPLQTTFGINAVVLNGGRPILMALKEILEAFLDFRETVILRRTAYDLARARDRAHLLVGLAVAVANIDEVIALIRSADDGAAAKAGLVGRDWAAGSIGPMLRLVEEEGVDPEAATYRLSERQAQAILDLRLHRLTALERDRIAGELGEIASRIQDLVAVLRDRDRLLEVMKAELLDVRARFATPRRTFIDTESEPDQDIEDLIQREDMVVTVTHKGYIKRVPLSTFRSQRRGGKGRSGMRTHEDDFVNRLFVANTHTPVLFFSSLGRVYKLKVYKLPLGNPAARGKAMINLFPHLAEDERISAVLPLPEDESTWGNLSAFFATARGKVRRNDLADFARVMANGKIAMGLDGDDQLIGVEVCDDGHDILLATASGKALRFPVAAVRVFRSRSSEGIRGITLGAGDRLISMSVIDHVEALTDERDAYLRFAGAKRRNGGEDEAADDAPPPPETAFDEARLDELAGREQMLLTVTRNGYGKRSSSYEYRITNRGGQGIVNIDASERNGEVAASFPVSDDDQIMLVTDRGKTIRIPVAGIRITGRNSQGVKLFHTESGERVVSVARLSDVEPDGDEEEE
ncbi:MAG: DNA gyrase subunit A [Geminicoccaceae bacterium]|nr:DNA gyrase subunit A [Geminicoccaceae bacterium]